MTEAKKNSDSGFMIESYKPICVFSKTYYKKEIPSSDETIFTDYKENDFTEVGYIEVLYKGIKIYFKNTQTYYLYLPDTMSQEKVIKYFKPLLDKHNGKINKKIYKGVL